MSWNFYFFYCQTPAQAQGWGWLYFPLITITTTKTITITTPIKIVAQSSNEDGFRYATLYQPYKICAKNRVIWPPVPFHPIFLFQHLVMAARALCSCSCVTAARIRDLSQSLVGNLLCVPGHGHWPGTKNVNLSQRKTMNLWKLHGFANVMNMEPVRPRFLVSRSTDKPPSIYIRLIVGSFQCLQTKLEQKQKCTKLNKDNVSRW